MTDFVGLVLAAGEGKRFGGPKAPYVLGDERLVDRAVRVLREAGAAEVFVVLGAWIDEVPHAQVIENPDWKTGMASSLTSGLTQITHNSSHDRVLVTLLDLPGLTSEAIERVAHDDSSISVATYGGTRGHPVAFNRQHWGELASSVSGDAGARHFLATHNDEVHEIEVSDVASGDDLDFRP